MKVAEIYTGKSDSFLTTFTTQNSTTSPRITTTQRPKNAKNPSKNHVSPRGTFLKKIPTNHPHS
jgi:hypothetical protein